MGLFKEVRTFLKSRNEGEESLEKMTAHLRELHIMIEEKKTAIQEGRDYLDVAHSELERDLRVIDLMEGVFKAEGIDCPARVPTKYFEDLKFEITQDHQDYGRCGCERSTTLGTRGS